MDHFNLNGKIAIVTGGASGIGAAIVDLFREAGANVYVFDRNNAGDDSINVDVADPDACNHAVQQVLSANQRIDVLVNNAGIGHVGTIEQTTADDLDRLYAVNVRGVFNLSKACIANMLEHQSGSIVNLASIGGMVGVKDRVAYCATKFAVVGITKSMALDHATSGVRINCICPGRVMTPFVKARIAEYPDPEKAYREMSMSQPVGRMAEPGEIAASALYLASDQSKFVTGSCFVIDGGFSAGR